MYYDHSTCMYYDHSTCMYCDHSTCMYYDHNTFLQGVRGRSLPVPQGVRGAQPLGFAGSPGGAASRFRRACGGRSLPVSQGVRGAQPPGFAAGPGGAAPRFCRGSGGRSPPLVPRIFSFLLILQIQKNLQFYNLKNSFLRALNGGFANLIAT